MTHTKTAPETLTTGYVARKLGVSTDTVLRKIDEGALVAYKLSDRGWWRIDRDSFLEYLRRVEKTK